MTICSCGSCRESGGFNDFADFYQFKEDISRSNLFRQVPVLKQFGGVGGLVEQWFECEGCGQVWRLVEPDPPFKGMWAEVNSETT